MSTDDIAGANGPPQPPNLPLRPEQLIGLARGFTWMAAGLLLTFLLLLGLIELRLPPLGVSLPSSMLGSAISLFGATLWWRAAGPTQPWRGRARWAMLLAALQIYFAPFALWWRHDLDNIQLFLNSMALLACLILLAWLLARQAEETGGLFANHSLVMEVRFARRALLAPVLIATVLLAGYETALLAGLPVPELPPHIVMRGMPLPPWLVMAHLGAMLLTISICWRSTEACHRALAQSVKLPGQP